MILSKRKALTGRGAKFKTAVVAVIVRDSKQVRAKMVENTDQPTLQGFVLENVAPTAKVCTDDASAYNGLPRDREAVRHSVGEYFQRHFPHHLMPWIQELDNRGQGPSAKEVLCIADELEEYIHRFRITWPLPLDGSALLGFVIEGVAVLVALSLSPK